MNEQQTAALAALRQANSIYRQADAHRTEIIGLAKKVGLTDQVIYKAIELTYPDKEQDG